MKALRWLLPYILCAACLVTIYCSIAHWVPVGPWFALYYLFSLWSLIGAEWYLTMVRQIKINSKWAVDDRFLSYLVTAPFIWPVRLCQLFTDLSTATPLK